MNNYRKTLFILLTFILVIFPYYGAEAAVISNDSETVKKTTVAELVRFFHSRYTKQQG